MAGLPGAIGRPNVVAQGFAATLGDVISLATPPVASAVPALPLVSTTGDTNAMAFATLAMLGRAPATILTTGEPTATQATSALSLTGTIGSAPALTADGAPTPGTITTTAPILPVAKGEATVPPAPAALAIGVPTPDAAPPVPPAN